MDKDLIEIIAQIIYLYNGGIKPKLYKDLTGRKKRRWKTDNDWDCNIENELCEWERDEFREISRIVVDYLYKSGRLK